METIGYQLSVGWPDGETMVCMESRNKGDLLFFLNHYAHEAGTVNLMKRTRQMVGDDVVDEFVEIPEDDICNELEGD